MEEKDKLTIFDFAPNELTQDAFLLWLFNSLNTSDETADVQNIARKLLCEFVYESTKVNVKKLPNEIVEIQSKSEEISNDIEKTKDSEKLKALKKRKKELVTYIEVLKEQKNKMDKLAVYLEEKRESQSLDIKEVFVEKQYNHIDVLILFKCYDIEIAMIIEDKVNTATHNQGSTKIDQLEVYRKEILNDKNYPNRLFLGIYYKNRVAPDKEIKYVQNYGYAPFLIESIVEILDAIEGECNYIFDEYRKYINNVWNKSYPNVVPQSLYSYRMQKNDSLGKKNENKIFWNSYFVYLANKYLDMDNIIKIGSVDKNEIELAGINYSFKKDRNILCEYGLQNHEGYFFYKIHLRDFPLSMEFATNAIGDGKINVKFVLYQMGNPTSDLVKKCRKIIYDRFLLWTDSISNLSISYPKDRNKDINEPKTDGKFKKQIATLTLAVSEEKFTCDFFEKEYIEMIIAILKQIKDSKEIYYSTF